MSIETDNFGRKKRFTHFLRLAIAVFGTVYAGIGESQRASSNIQFLTKPNSSPGYSKLEVPSQQEQQTKVALVGKFWGARANCDKLPVFNDGFMGVKGVDLGPMAAFGPPGQEILYLISGDATNISPDCYDPTSIKNNVFSQDIVAYTDPVSSINFDNGITFAGYLGGGSGKRILDSGNSIPSSLFTLDNNMYVAYMNVLLNNGNYTDRVYSGIGRFDGQNFIPYKTDVLRWTGNQFGNVAIIPDDPYVYFLGSPAGRFGGIKGGRLPRLSFNDPNNSDLPQYLLEGGIWSAPTQDKTVIESAKWLIEPKGSWPLKNMSDSDQCKYQTIGEFSIVYNPFLQSFMLITARTCGLDNGVFYYTAPKITGPWSAEIPLQMPNPLGLDPDKNVLYAPYTTAALMKNNGQKMYLTLSNWPSYGVYLFRLEFIPSDKKYNAFLPSIRK